MNDVPCIAFNSKNYESKDEFFQDIATMLKILTTNNYVCSFEFEDCGIYVLRFDHEDYDVAEFELKWVKTEDGCES